MLPGKSYVGTVSLEKTVLGMVPVGTEEKIQIWDEEEIIKGQC
jgi:aspartate 1-decarboxylase